MQFIVPAIFWALALLSAIVSLSGGLAFALYAVLAAAVGVLLAHFAYIKRPVPPTLRALAWVTALIAVVFCWVTYQVIGQIN